MTRLWHVTKALNKSDGIEEHYGDVRLGYIDAFQNKEGEKLTCPWKHGLHLLMSIGCTTSLSTCTVTTDYWWETTLSVTSLETTTLTTYDLNDGRTYLTWIMMMWKCTVMTELPEDDPSTVKRTTFKWYHPKTANGMIISVDYKAHRDENKMIHWQK